MDLCIGVDGKSLNPTMPEGEFGARSNLSFPVVMRTERYEVQGKKATVAAKESGMLLG